MSKSFHLKNESHQAELSSLVAKEVRRVLVRYDEVIAVRRISSRIEIATDGSLLPTCQQAIHDDLTDLASEFVHRLAAEAVGRFDTNVDKEPPASVQTEDEPCRNVPKWPSRQAEPLRIEEWAGPVAGATHLEKRLGIPRSTLHWWQRHNDVIALRRGARKHVFPLAQFIDGRPIPGIRQVLSSLSNPRSAWLWLIRSSPLLDNRIPIEMLRQDLIAEVTAAAKEFSLI